MHNPEAHVYDRIREEIDAKQARYFGPISREQVEEECRLLKEIGLEVQTYADAARIANVIIELSLGRI